MDTLKKHEEFEIEVLEKLKNAGFLKPLVFIGGTMLRLCYDLNRYSVDMDFWFIKKTEQGRYFKNLKDFLALSYEITDAKSKFNTILIEIRSKDYPRRLKIEIRKTSKKCESEEKIAFSKYSPTQVILKVLSPEEIIKSKIEAALDRKDIRDFFDIEFLLRQGIPLGCDNDQLEKLKVIASRFTMKDYKVTLGSILNPIERKYYAETGFDFLLRKINANLSSSRLYRQTL